MKIAIIGCGYVGSRAARAWLVEGHTVTVTTRRKERVHELQECSSDVFLLGDLIDLIPGQDLILLSVAAGRGGDVRSTYLETAKRLIEVIQPHQQIIYTGSTSVYGDAMGNWVDETSALRPSTDHARILIETEQTLQKHEKTCIFRMGEIIGPGRNIADRLRDINGGEIKGTGENFTNWIHIDDIIAALDLALKQKWQGIFNLCNGEHVPRKEAYQKICAQERIPLPSWNPNKTPFFRGNKKVSNQKIKDQGFRSFTNIMPGSF